MIAPGTQSGALAPALRALGQIDEPSVRAALDGYLARPDTLGLFLCGSRVLGWAEPDGDFDAFIVATEERFRSLRPEDTLVRLYAEGETPRRMIGDFSIFSEEVLEESLRSPLSIDHWPYVDAVLVYDRTGTLADWQRRLAAFPDAIFDERALHQYLELAAAYHYATLDDVRGFAADRQMNLFRAALAGVQLWFTLQRRWAPPLKWWTREVDRLGIRPDTRAVLESAVLNPSIEVATHLREHLKTELRHAGVAAVDDIVAAFARTFLPERRAAIYRDTYL